MDVLSGQPTPFIPGFGMVNGAELNQQLGFRLGGHSYSTGLIATGTNAATALQLVMVANLFAGGAAGTGCNLPQAISGRMCLVDVRQAQSTIKIYSAQSFPLDTIDGTVGTTASTLTKAHGAAMFLCYEPGAWISYLLGTATL